MRGLAPIVALLALVVPAARVGQRESSAWQLLSAGGVLLVVVCFYLVATRVA